MEQPCWSGYNRVALVRMVVGENTNNGGKKEKIDKGEPGRKTGKGYYDY